MLQLDLKPAGSFRAGEIPTFEVVLRNAGASATAVLLYMFDYRLKAAMVAQNEGKGASYEAQPFHTVRWEPARAQDVVRLEPGAEVRHRLSWDDPYAFAFIQRHSQPPVVTPGYRIKGFPAGTFRFSTGLFEQMGIYVGADGVFDHRLEGRRLPAEVPDGAVWGPVSVSSLEAEVSLTFA